MSPNSLPREVCDIIVAEVAKDNDGQQWLVKRGDAQNRVWTPLRALTQVNHNFRQSAMASMWQVVKMHPLQGDFSSIGHLRRLIEELPAAAPYVQRIQLELPQSRLGGSYNADEIGPYKADWLKGLDPADIIPERSAVATLVRLLSRRLVNCHNLTHLSWTGWIYIDFVIIDNLSRCSSLSSLFINIGLVNLTREKGGWIRDSQTERLELRPPSHITFPSLKCVDFSIDLWGERLEDLCGNCCDCLMDKYTHTMEATGSRLVKILLQYGLPERLNIGSPRLLLEPWMMPLWTQVKQIEWSETLHVAYKDTERFEYAEQPSDQDYLEATRLFITHLANLDINAVVFGNGPPPKVGNIDPKGSVSGDPVGKIADKLLDLLRSDRKLRLLLLSTPVTSEKPPEELREVARILWTKKQRGKGVEN
ncbi:unnamed protein product [Sympodiomycopsis kandeliae]